MIIATVEISFVMAGKPPPVKSGMGINVGASTVLKLLAVILLMSLSFATLK